MRNSTTMLLMALLAALCVAIFFFADPAFKDRVLVMLLLISTIVSAMAYGMLLGQKHSPHLSGYGICTSLEDTNPVYSLNLSNPDEPLKPYEMDIYPNCGNKKWWLRGGGKHGYTVVRRDLTLRMDGDPANLWVKSSPPDLYALGAQPESEYHDLRELPRPLYNALRQIEGWHDKAKVAVYWNPPGIDPLKDWDEKKGMPFQTLYHKVNRENIELQKQNLNLLKANTKYSRTHLTAARAYDKEIQGEDFDERGDENE